MSSEHSRARQHVMCHDALYRVCPEPLDNLPGYAYECEIVRDGFDIALFAAHAIDCPVSIQDSVSTRQAEFFAGRLAARHALQRLGFGHHSVPQQKDRTPGWPLGVVGSISHKKHHAVACVRHSSGDGDGFGLDIEDMMPEKIAERLSGHILCEDEKICLARGYSCHPAHCITLAFSAKESLFKALYPSVGVYFDFLDVRIVEANLYTLIIQLVRTLSSQRTKGDLFTVHIHSYRAGILTHTDL